MKQFKQFKRAYDFQQGNEPYYDNTFCGDFCTGVVNIDDLPYAIESGNVLWVIMANGFYLDDYEESATEYGVTKSGKWAAVYDGHCSCYGWEASADDITYYSNLDELIKCDVNAKVILEHKDTLQKLYPFLKF